MGTEGHLIIRQWFMTAAASSCIVDCSAYLLSSGCCHQLSIFIGAGLICAAATEPYPVYIQRRGLYEEALCRTGTHHTYCLQINRDVCTGEV